MNQIAPSRGSVPVGHISELDSMEAASVLYFRLWFDGPESRKNVWNDFATALGPETGKRAVSALEEICRACVDLCRRPIMRHQVTCQCIGADEACLANLVGAATDGQREDALLLSLLLFEPDFAPLLVGHAESLGTALRKMNLGNAPRPTHANSSNRSLH
ncbi:hypothetical protein [Algicella marina]|uniref:Uncharacterized protein n=1 Tax=Algicella marina TaxID=2683284 RepID=A0A6P1SZS1_9RHOB|nr:hypothetical protein [Algicella marina]QHQ35257.1 hypothetical protein GO499_08615 [Algicella marina]